LQRYQATPDPATGRDLFGDFVDEAQGRRGGSDPSAVGGNHSFSKTAGFAHLRDSALN
jgi:hypothetical protein